MNFHDKYFPRDSDDFGAADFSNFHRRAKVNNEKNKIILR